MATGLIGVWYADVRSRQARDRRLLAEAIRTIAVFYAGLVVPGALLLLGSGTWLIVTVYAGWAFLGMPWLAGMVVLFAFEFIEGNTITRLYFMRLFPVRRGGWDGHDGRGELRRGIGTAPGGIPGAVPNGTMASALPGDPDRSGRPDVVGRIVGLHLEHVGAGHELGEAGRQRIRAGAVLSDPLSIDQEHDLVTLTLSTADVLTLSLLDVTVTETGPTGGGALSTTTAMDDMALLPAASNTTATSLCGPFTACVVFHGSVHGDVLPTA
jgi:hypothetical protein